MTVREEQERLTGSRPGEGLYVDELLHALDASAEDELSLRHPMTFGEVCGRDLVEEVATATRSIFQDVELKNAWSGEDIGGREWHGHFHGRPIRGVTVAQRFGGRIQVDIFLALFPAAVRQALLDACGNLIAADAWRLPPGIDTALPAVPAGEMLDPKLQFGLAPDALFTSPVACKPIHGAADIERVCGHSVAVYGDRASGPRLTVGAATLSLWTGSVAGLPLEVASVIHWQDPQHVRILSMAMRPWPVVELFQARMKARTLPFLDESYFESDAEPRLQEI